MIGLAEQIEIAEYLFKKNGEIRGMMLYIPKTRTLMGISCKDEREKNLFDIVLKKYCREKEVEEFVTLTEAWMVKEKSSVELPLKVMPQDDPKRIEILMICLISKNGDEIAFSEISTENGKRYLKGWQYDVNMQAETRFDKALKY